MARVDPQAGRQAPVALRRRFACASRVEVGVGEHDAARSGRPGAQALWRPALFEAQVKAWAFLLAGSYPLWVSKRRPQVFLSYARQDEPLAREFVEALKKEGLEPWWDAMISPGENWAHAAGAALENSDALVFLVSPEWTRSGWTSFEMEHALSGSRFEKRVFPILVRPGGELPWVLQPYLLADFSAKRPQKREISEVAQKISARIAECEKRSAPAKAR